MFKPVISPQTAAALCLFAVLSGCAATGGAAPSAESAEQTRLKAQQARVQEQIGAAESERAGLAATVATLTANQTEMEGRAQKYRENIEEVRLQTKAYLLDHKMAVAALAAGVGGAGVALDSRNQFSSDAREVGAVVGAIAAIWAIANHHEVLEVADTLMKADSYLRDTGQAAQRLQAQLETAAQELQSARERLGGADARLLSLRAAFPAQAGTETP